LDHDRLAMPPHVRAPGRVNLIGDHTDYQDGWCLPMAIDREVRLDFTARNNDRVIVTSDDPVAGETSTFAGMVDAARAVLAAHGRRSVGLDGAITSTVPVGAGLSSSAAVEVALCIALAAVADLDLSALDLARAAQEVEHRATGVPCGVMDQMASVFGVCGHALLLDCRALSVEPVALPDNAEVIVFHSGVVRALTGSAYAERRRACEDAARRLGLTALRDATMDQVGDDPYARHVVSENARVLAYVDAMRAGDLDELGRLMSASHASLRDDFRVSTAELDTLVELLVAAGAFGARLTGAGFGGCAVALFPAGAGVDGARSVVDHYRARTGLDATPYLVRAVDGAGLVTAN
jgi:galactokinase